MLRQLGDGFAALRQPQWFSGLGADVRVAIRALVRRPWSTLAIAGTLALGLGATTTIYAVFNYVLFRPVPGVASHAQFISINFLTAGRVMRSNPRPETLPALREAASAAGLNQLAGSCCETQLAVSTTGGSEPTFEGP
jgi:hypothetical protein